jgi:16S rRNA (guanine966-N2)-methyltransferase
VGKTALGQVRIIAGTLRGSKLSVLNLPGLRPSSDRVRETLFNWLQHRVHGSRVLDLFAGTGVLGFEALSRNALQVTMLENNPAACALLDSNKKRLKIENLEIVQLDSLQWLKNSPADGFNLVFLDPPYASQYWRELWPLLLSKLSSNALIYIETGRNDDCLLPSELIVLKQGKTQQSNYFLTQLKNVAID